MVGPIVEESLTVSIRSAQAGALIRRISESAEAMFLVCDSNGKMLDCNDAWRKFAGLKADSPIAGQAWALLSDIDVAKRELVQQELLDTGASHPRYSMQASNGSMCEIQWHLSWDRGAGRCYGVAFDISGRTSAQQQLRDAGSFFAHSSDHLIVTNQHHLIVRANQAATIALGLDANASEQPPLGSFVHDADWGAALAALKRAKTEGIATWTGRVNVRGGFAFMHTTILHEADGDGTVLVGRDVTSERLLTEELKLRADSDDLTGLANRSKLLETIDEAIVHDRVALLFCDLDRFKVVNDSLGHTAGDTLLRTLARRLAQLDGAGRLVARIGGDEFGVLITSPDRGEADRVVREALELVAQPVQVGSHQISMNMSIGVSTSEQGAATGQEMLTEADTAMYEAKARGGAQAITFGRDLSDRAAHRFEVEAGLRSVLGLGLGLVVAEFQPIVSLIDERVEGAEALIRIETGDGVVVQPAGFLDVAAEAGLLLELDRQMLALAMTAFRDLASPVSVGVNAAPSELLNRSFAHDVLTLAEQMDFDPARLTIEITETSALTDMQRTTRNLQTLRAAGTSIALDDFGTGFSSLSHLRTLPIDSVKIDASFTASVTADPATRAVIAGIVHMCTNMGLTIVAEGIENVQQLGMLRDLGCTTGQGYLFHHPMSIAQLKSVLDRQN